MRILDRNLMNNKQNNDCIRQKDVEKASERQCM